MSKKIVSLSDFEHVLKRPTIYIGSVDKTEEKLPIIEDKKIVQKNFNISVGFYKLLSEIIDNAWDEAKRCNGSMPKITVDIYSDTGRVIISDTGNGFLKGYEKNEKTGVSNVETAMTMLRAGSNFYNEDTKENLIGTNGVGASIVNMLSSKFEIVTSDGKKRYMQRWENFQSVTKKTTSSKSKGTRIDFTPREDIFPGCKWDKEIIQSYFTFRNYIKNLDPKLRKTKFGVRFDGEILKINQKFLPPNTVSVKSNKYGEIHFWPSYNGSTKLSFVNGTRCSGIHQKIVQDSLNELIKYDKAHEFYDTLVILELEPKDVLFGDQNKTKFVSQRPKIQPIYDKYFKTSVKRELLKSDALNIIKESIDTRLHGKSMSQISKIAKQKKVEISDKYYPASKRKDMIFLTEGLSAMGSILQRRDSATMGMYALRGKVKNVKTAKDLTGNKEIEELIRVIGLDPNPTVKPKYDKIVISTDGDFDGSHIASLIINMIQKWFPHIIRQGRLLKLETPIVVAKKGGQIKRYYSLDEFQKNNTGLTNIRYLKGLGSLSLSDWEYVFSNLKLSKYVADPEANEKLEMAFGDDVNLRKQWLTG